MSNKIWEIKTQRCFTESAETPGFDRFYSADPMFPMSIYHPSDVSFFYDFNDPRYLKVEFFDTFTVAREDLILSAQQGDAEAQQVVQGRADLIWFMQQEFERRRRESRDREIGYVYNVGRYSIKDRDRDMAIVGEGRYAFEAPRVVWTTKTGDFGGEWVFFPHIVNRTWLWIIRREPDLEEDVFEEILSSFRVLKDEFFRSLPAQPEV